MICVLLRVKCVAYFEDLDNDVLLSVWNLYPLIIMMIMNDDSFIITIIVILIWL